MTSEINSAQVNNINTVPKKSSLLKDTASGLGMNAVVTGGFGGVSCVKRNGGFKNAIESVKSSNAALEAFAKKLDPEMDVFTKNHVIAKNYEEYTKAASQLQKLKKLEDKQAAGKFDLFNKRAKAIEKLKNDESALSDTVKNIENGSAAAKYKGINLKSDVKGLFKEELLNPANVLIVGIGILSRVTSEVVPAFKEQGFKAGIKKLGSCIAKTAVDTVSNAGFSAVFRVLGSTALSFLGPVGRALGGTLGDMVGSIISSKIITKVFKEDKTNDTTTDETTIADSSQQQEEQALPQVAQVDTNATNTTASTNPIVVNSNELPEQAKSIRQRKTAKTTRTTKTATRGYAKPQGSLNFYNPQSLSFMNSNNSRLKTNYLA